MEDTLHWRSTPRVSTCFYGFFSITISICGLSVWGVGGMTRRILVVAALA